MEMGLGLGGCCGRVVVGVRGRKGRDWRVGDGDVLTMRVRGSNFGENVLFLPRIYFLSFFLSFTMQLQSD